MPIFAIIIATFAAVAYNWFWHLERMELGPRISGPDGQHVAQYLSMPERSAAPYGHGVYVRHKYLPFSPLSTLVFAAYCGSGEQLHWRSAKELVVKCDVIEGSPVLPRPPEGVVVTHIDDGR